MKHSFEYISDADEYTNKFSTKVTTETVMIEDIIAAFRQYLLACGYTEKTVTDYLGE